MKMKPVVNRMVALAKENLIYLDYGEYIGNPKDLDDLSLDFLMEMAALCEIAINGKLSKVD